MSSSGEFHVYQHNFPRATAKRSRVQSREKKTVRGNFYSDDQKQLLSSVKRKPKRREQSERTLPNRRRHVRSATQGIHPSHRVKFNPLRKLPAQDDVAARSRCHQRILEKNSRVNRVSWGHLMDKDVNMLRNCQLKEDHGCRISPRRSKSKSKSRGKEAKKWSDLDAVAREMVMRPEGEKLQQYPRDSKRFAANDIIFPRNPQQNESARMQPQPSGKTRTETRKRNKPKNWRARVKSQPSDLTRIRKKQKDMIKSNRQGIIMHSHAKELDQRRHRPQSAHDRHKSSPLYSNNALPNNDRRVRDERYLWSGRRNSLSDSEHIKEDLKPRKRKKTKKKRDRSIKRHKNYKHRTLYKPDPRQAHVFDDRFENGQSKPKPNLMARRAQRRTIEIVVNDNRQMLGAVDQSISETRDLVNPNTQWLSNPNTPNHYEEYNRAGNDAFNLHNLQRGEHFYELARGEKPSHPRRESPERQLVDRDMVGSSRQKWQENLQNRNLNRNGKNPRDSNAYIRQKDQWHSQVSHHRSFEEEDHRGRNIHGISIAEERPTERVPQGHVGIGFVYPQPDTQWEGKQEVSDVSSQDQQEYSSEEDDSKRTELQSPDTGVRSMNVQNTRVSWKTDNASALDSGKSRGRSTENVNRIQNNNPWRGLWPNLSHDSYSTSRNQEKRQEYTIRRGRGNERASVEASPQIANNRAKNDSQTNTNNRSKDDHSMRRQRVSQDVDESTTQSSSSSDSTSRDDNFLNNMWKKDETEPTSPERKEITHIEINLSPNETIAVRNRASIYRTRNSVSDERVEHPNLSPSRTAVSPVRTMEEYYDSISESIPSVPSNNNEQIDSDYAFAVQLHLAGDDEFSPSQLSSPINRNRKNPANNQLQSDEILARSLQEELFSGLREPSLSYPRERRLAVTPIPSEEDFLRFRRIPNYSLPSPEPYRSPRFLFRSFPRGAEQSAIDELPTRKYVLRGRYTDDEKMEGDSKEAENETITCAVCMEIFQAGEDLKTLPCMHFYHTVCIDQWLLQNRTCPVCKYDITENDLVSL